MIIKFISSKDQLADIMMKPLSTPQFLLLRSKLTVTEPPSTGTVKDKIDSSIEFTTGEINSYHDYYAQEDALCPPGGHSQQHETL
jgi:hypothetical protein